MQTQNLNTRPLLFIAVFCAALHAAPAKAAVEVVYAPDLAAASSNTLEGWTKEGGYGAADVVLDWAVNSAAGVPSLFFDSLFHEPNGGVESTTDTTLTGDTGVAYDRAATYRLSFQFARVKTNGGKGEDVPFYGALKYQLWAGDPATDGILIAEGRDPAVRQGDQPKNGIVTFVIPPGNRGRGRIFIRLSTLGVSAQGADPYRYQQAEICDLRLEKMYR